MQTVAEARHEQQAAFEHALERTIRSHLEPQGIRFDRLTVDVDPYDPEGNIHLLKLSNLREMKTIDGSNVWVSIAGSMTARRAGISVWIVRGSGALARHYYNVTAGNPPSQWATRAMAPAAPDLTFGAVIERVLRRYKSAPGDFLNFDTGRVVVAPAEVIDHSFAAERKSLAYTGLRMEPWLETNGVDFVAEHGDTGFRLFDCALWHQTPEINWEKTAAKELLEFVPEPKGGASWISLGVTQAFGFRTRGGVIGIAQLVAETGGNPSHVKIRYKLVQEATTNVPAVPSQSPGGGR